MTHTTAPAGQTCQGNTPYSGSSFTCAGNNGNPSPAVHTWEGRHYCAYHSPFDITETDRAEITARDAQPEPAKSSRKPYAPWFQALLDQHETCADTDDFERSAYQGYVSYEQGGTDGYYAPNHFDNWVDGFRKDPAMGLYRGNDRRVPLAPYVASYIDLTLKEQS